MIRYVTRAIQHYPKTETPWESRKRSQFKTDRDDSIRMVGRELELLGAESWVLEVDYAERDIRIDGTLRKDARPIGPRIVADAETDKGPLRMACDTYEVAKANIHAIALTLAALRAIDRYGAATKGEQYTGWLALPSVGTTTTRVNDAWALLILESQWGFDIPLKDRTREKADTVFRQAIKRVHPDSGGSDDRLRAVNVARDAILEDIYR